MNEAPPLADGSAEALMGAVVDEFLERLERGERPDVEAYAARHPQLATVLRQMLPALEVMRSAAAEPPGDAAAAIAPEAPLGDFRLVREVGRGGMGVVYEAVQVSLGRRVALKVLPFAAALDPKQLQRFHNEAQAAANLHHQHIVPVYCVGCERGVHYYAMQFIEGQTLAALIQQLRPAPGREAGGAGTPEPAVQPPPETTPQAGAAAPTLPVRGAAFYRTAARLGVQAAEALDHAHQMGVIHRDVKPANLMVDGHGRLWVADFGLARFHGAAGLTLTGDVVGTLRYASPEQLQARPGAVDHRTDVYSLGVTLYELLTLEPAFDAPGREQLLVQIMAAEPIPPRRRNREVPAELETIVLKAMEKSPDDRYGTARELADDLQRFLDDAPIRARRPTPVQRVRRWGRRHRPAVWSALVFGLLTLGVAAASLGWVARDRALREATIAHDRAVRDAALDDEVRRTLEGAAALLEAGKWPEARGSVEEADKLLAAAGRAERPARLRELQRDVAMAERLEDIGGRFDYLSYDRNLRYDPSNKELDAAYAEAFQAYGIDVTALPPGEAAERIRARAIRSDLTQALDSWISLVRCLDAPGARDWRNLLRVVQQADPDPWRNQVRESMYLADGKGLEALTASVDVGRLPPETLHLLAGAQWPSKESHLAFLLRAQQRHPGDVWINANLGTCLTGLHRYDEALRFCTAALALRPKSPSSRIRLGWVWHSKGSYSEAREEFSRAIDLDPKCTRAWWFRAGANLKLGRRDEALNDINKVLDLEPWHVGARGQRALIRQQLGQWDQAAADFSAIVERPQMEAPDREAPGRADARYRRGYAYAVVGRWREAADDLMPANLASAPLNDVWFRAACLRLLQGDDAGYRELCRQLLDRIGQSKGGFKGHQAFLASRTCMLCPETAAEPGQAVSWAEPARASTLYLHTLALAHYRAGHLEQAAASAQDSIHADPHWGGIALNWLVLALAHRRLGHTDEAGQWLEKATSWREKAVHGSGKGDGIYPPDLSLSVWLEFQVLYLEAAAPLKGQ